MPGQVRLSGEPYLSHPLAVAEVLAELGFDAHSVAAGLLHDTVEDTKVTLEEVDAEFGEQVADIVDGVTKISMMTFDSKEEQQAENIRKMILAMSHDIRVPIVKLADRVHNMRTLDFQKAHKRQRIAQETMDIYVPLANRLGLHRLKLELEGLSFKYIHPDVYAQISDWLESNQVVERQLIAKIIAKLEGILSSNQIEGTVWGRIKHIYSIYKKMTEQNLTLDDMHDILAFRVIVKDVRDCYAVLGLVHAQWKPVPGRFKDYISMPKANGYQSLHTTVIGPEGERIEIQIRTEEMHRLAEHGVASHWLYKERHHAVSVKDAPEFEWLREIVNRQGQESDSKEFMHTLRMDLFKDEVYVFTPAGDVKELPEGATPLDFAFLIHTQVGSRCVGAKVNGKLVPLNTALKSGDTVEIITDKNRRPSRDWLKIVKTAKARSRIQQYLRTEERAAAMGLGRETAGKGSPQGRHQPEQGREDGHLSTLVNSLAAGSVDELMASIGYARFTTKQVVKRLQAIVSPPEILETPDAVDTVVSHRKRKEQSPPPPPKDGRHLRARRGRHDGPHRPLLQPRARRFHCGLHQPRARRDRPHGDVSEHSGDGARSPRFRAVGRPRDAALPGAHPYHGPQPEGLAGGYRHRAARRGRQHRRLSLAALVDGRSEMETGGAGARRGASLPCHRPAASFAFGHGSTA